MSQHTDVTEKIAAIEFSEKVGIKEAAKKFHTSYSNVCNWRRTMEKVGKEAYLARGLASQPLPQAPKKTDTVVQKLFDDSAKAIQREELASLKRQIADIEHAFTNYRARFEQIFSENTKLLKENEYLKFFAIQYFNAQKEFQK